ncbi:MAG TPA: cation transporter [Burkholderiales bacterium]|nr:cation transporter [Burkholderiales bacterium]
MANRCEDKACAIEALQTKQAATLKTVLGINAVMFVVVLAMGIYANSAALLSDALDNLGDALTYALSLYAVGRGIETKSRVALFKGLLILGAGIGVMATVIYKAAHPAMPAFEAMGVTSLVALAANATCLAVLWRHRSEDVNMSSVWECSRNDIASNLSVFVAAGGVWLFASPWPDLVVGFALALLFLMSGAKVIRSAMAGALVRQI